jgi:phosphotransferase system enzyme I (PtsP)
MARTLRPRVHARGNRRLDGILDFLEFAARPMPIVTLLDEAPRRIAALVDAEVCSLYAVEGDKSEVVMRGNVGFRSDAIGQVRLRVGEGITGEAVEYLRPISTETAEQHGAYKHFAGLGEEHFPVFLAVPIRGDRGPLGALVVQRRTRPFRDADVELDAVLGGLIAAAIRHAELVDEARERRARRASGGTRKVTLTGVPAISGRALGAVAALRRPATRAARRSEQSPSGSDVPQLRSAFSIATRAIHQLLDRASGVGLGREAQFLTVYAEILGDARFRERAADAVEKGVGIARALSAVARDVTRTAASVTRDPFLALTMLARWDKRSAIPSKAILFGDTITVFDVLVTTRFHPAGIALSERASGPRAQVLLHLMGVPAVSDIKGLFRWASDGDIALLDGDHGLIVLNPSKSEMASLREDRRGTRAPAAPT